MDFIIYENSLLFIDSFVRKYNNKFYILPKSAFIKKHVFFVIQVYNINLKVCGPKHKLTILVSDIAFILNYILFLYFYYNYTCIIKIIL